MSILTITAAGPGDLAEIQAIEDRCFPPTRRSSPRALRRSLSSPTQSVWVARKTFDGGAQTVGAMVVYLHQRSLRIFSLAVLPDDRTRGVGRRLLDEAVELATRTGRSSILLEADAGDQGLLDWYRRAGFEVHRFLNDYYAPEAHAVRMRRSLRQGQ